MKRITPLKALLLTCCVVGALTSANGAWAIDNCAQVTAATEADADSTPNDKTDAGGDADITRQNILTAVNGNTNEDDEACAAVTINIVYDFGDAPDKYRTTLGAANGPGAQHEIVPWLRLGATTDSETDGQPNYSATGDGADEDGVNIPTLTGGQPSPTFTATVTNTSTADAYLACWVDYNGDGVFNETEFGSATVPAGSTNASITVTMPDVPASAFAANDNGDGSSYSYVRCRLSNVALTASDAGGVVDDGTNGVSDGEVEDYEVDFNPQPELDLALIKRPASVNGTAVTDPANVNVNAGDTVTFSIEIKNQGQVDATGIVITDYIPAGLTLADANWTDNGDGTATLSTPFNLTVAAKSTTLTISFTVNQNAAQGTMTNAAEISAMTGVDSYGNTVTDVDSTPDNNPNNETDVEDDVIYYTDTDHDGKKDEDDHDIAVITVNPQVDLSLTKAVQDTSGSAVTNVHHGDTVVYVLTVTNGGPHDATGVVINDVLPGGITYVSDNAGAAGTGNSYDNATGAWDIGNVPNGESRTLEITVTID